MPPARARDVLRRRLPPLASGAHGPRGAPAAREADVTDPFDPDALTPDDRAHEVAALLATGYLRYRSLRASRAAPAFVPGAPPAGDEPQRRRLRGVEQTGDPPPRSRGRARMGSEFGSGHSSLAGAVACGDIFRGAIAR